MPLHPRHPRTPVVLEPPFAMASDLGSTIRRPDPTIAVAMAREAFPHLNWTPEPLRELAGEHVADGNTPARQQGRLPSPTTHA